MNEACNDMFTFMRENKLDKSLDKMIEDIDKILDQIKIQGSFVNDKNSIIISLTEDKRSQDDVDNIELYSKQIHYSKNPYPPHRHREEGKKRQFDTAK